MAKTLLIGFALAFIAAAVLLVNALSQTSPVTTQRASDFSSVIALPNGAVFNAPKGTVGRTLVDWLDSGDQTERRFELGSGQFEGRSTEPTAEARVRIGRGVEILKAHREVVVHLIGYTSASGNPSADLKLSQERAIEVEEALREGGIAPSRLSAEGRGGADPIGDNRTPAGRARNERVVVVFRHPQ